jgi:hypothetical protein
MTKEQRKQKQSDWHKKNADHIRIYKKKWRIANRAKIRTYNQKYYLEHIKEVDADVSK